MKAAIKTQRLAVRNITLTLALMASEAWAQDFAIDWSTIYGGGGTSTSGVYSVSGTIGQPDAGTMSGGTYSVQVGFWSVIAAVPMPGAPTLGIRASNGEVVIFWPASATEFELQETGDLTTGNWTDVQSSPSTAGDEKQITIPAPAGNGFYRLKR